MPAQYIFSLIFCDFPNSWPFSLKSFPEPKIFSSEDAAFSELYECCLSKIKDDEGYLAALFIHADDKFLLSDTWDFSDAGAFLKLLNSDWTRLVGIVMEVERNEFEKFVCDIYFNELACNQCFYKDTPHDLTTII